MDKEDFMIVLQSALFHYWDGLTFEQIKNLMGCDEKIVKAGVELADYLKGIEVKKIV
jgi:hypothetical protein